MVPSVVSGEEAHVVLSKVVFPSHHMYRHVAVRPVSAIAQVVVLPQVDGAMVVLAVAWMVTHRLPASSVLCTALNVCRRVVMWIVASVVHLSKAVNTVRHAVPLSELHAIPLADQVC
jgi:hypothetical protein